MKESSRQDDTKNMDASIKNATDKWVRSFNDIPLSIIEKLRDAGDVIYEITPTEGEDFDTIFPMWGTMWSFSDSAANHWLEENLKAMADCGFRIYEQEDYGYVFGIDGCGYDFYEAHWIPLYKAFGLKWHL